VPRHPLRARARDDGLGLAPTTIGSLRRGRRPETGLRARRRMSWSRTPSRRAPHAMIGSGAPSPRGRQRVARASVVRLRRRTFAGKVRDSRAGCPRGLGGPSIQRWPRSLGHGVLSAAARSWSKRGRLHRLTRHPREGTGGEGRSQRHQRRSAGPTPCSRTWWRPGQEPLRRPGWPGARGGRP
jgi:hypothetical protein